MNLILLVKIAIDNVMELVSWFLNRVSIEFQYHIMHFSVETVLLLIGMCGN